MFNFRCSYQLSTAAVFDREMGSKYHVDIICSDKGSPSLNTTGHVLVRILDVNDHAPEFSSKHVTFRVAENYQIDSVLFAMRAEDPDEG